MNESVSPVVLPEFDGLCTVTMQGGGVFGLSLLGQLQAVEKMTGLRPVAYAGASAGGLMAALRWAGLKPQEIKEELKGVVGDRGRLAQLLGPNSRHSDRWSADPRVVIRVRDLIFRKRSAKGLRRWLSWLSIGKDLALVVFRPGVAVKAWKRGGLFAADGFVVWLDEILRKRLHLELEAAKAKMAEIGGIEAPDQFSKWLEEIGIPPLGTDAFNQHRPRFIDFDLARYVLPNDKTWPILILSVTSISRGEPIFIDSYSAAFEHIPISDAVRATIAFPLAFQPTPLGIVGEQRDDEPDPLARRSLRLATREALLSKERAEKLSIFRDHFMDGGVMANFPIWAVARYLRQTLYGHTQGQPSEAIRLHSGSWDSLPFRERFTQDGENIAPPNSKADVAKSNIDGVLPLESDLDVPLRALAFRPMLHLGLRLIEPRPDVTENDSFGFKIGALLTSGARTFYEKMALAEGGRLILTEQLSDATGWTDRLLDFDKLTPEKIETMFSNGEHYAHSRLKNINLQVSPASETVDEILRSAVAGIFKVFNETLSNISSDVRVADVDASLYALDGKNLQIVTRVTLPETGGGRGGGYSHILQAEIDAPELYCYHERCAVIATPAWWWGRGGEVSLAARIVFPLIDFSFGKRDPSAAWFPRGIEKIDDHMYALSERTNAVLFGAVAIDIFGGAQSKALWEELIGRAKAKDELLFAGLKMLQVHTDRISALLTEALSRSSSEWSPEGPKRRKPQSPKDLVGFSTREADFLDQFYKL
jgi:predicted acylesterase/phospholipase RssA